jgi:endonuclease/exonuclease/phosphatase family metal-dependent hydrolase
MSAIAALYDGATVRAMRWGTRSITLVTALALLSAACSSGSGGDVAGDTTTATVRVVNQNLLHGTACPADSNRCDLPGRVALFLRQLTRARCPEIVAIEEGNRATVQELRKGLGACDYHLVWDDDPGQDREIVLSTLRVGASERLRLPGPLRTAYRVSLASAAGPVDLLATHLASSSDDRPCDTSTCPAPCTVTDTLNTCQARQIVQTLREDPQSDALTVVVGDLNARPDEPTVAALTAAGLVDTHDSAGNPECDPATGAQCTSGRVDDSLVDMENATSKQTERIDYVFLRPVARCRVVRPTGVFAPAGGPTRDDGLVFPADHSGVEATIRCRTTAAQRTAPIRPPGTPSTTRVGASATLTPAVRADVTAAFDGLFAPNPDPDSQLSHVENGAALRDSFLARRAAVGDLANRTSVRIDSFDGATPDTVDVTFSILISGAVVLDALPGRARLVDGEWLVTTDTYCQVATLGVDTIPEACR